MLFIEGPLIRQELKTGMDMDKFFYPRSIVVFGVSDSPGNLGREIIKNLNRFGFAGDLYGFGRNAMEVEGRRVVADLADIAIVPDLAVLLVPAAAVLGALEACGRKGITHAVMETGGFTEFGEDRKELEEAIVGACRTWGITCMGPNCIGTINMEHGVCLPFVPFDPEEIEKGKNSFLSQSGGLIHETVRRCAAESVGLNKLASMGNKLMVDETDVLEFLISDRSTDVIGLYLEDVKNGRRLMDLAASTDKPVLVLKGNASPAGREIASFHTAALVGDEAVTAAAFSQAGIHQVASLQEMVESFKVFDMPAMKGENMAVISRSGGQSVLLADEAYRHGFRLARLSPALFDLISERSKGGVIRRTNPIDLGDVFDEVFYLDVLAEVLKEDAVDGAAFFFDYEINQSAVLEMVKGVERLTRQYEKPVVLCMVPDRTHWFKARDAARYPFFSHPAWAFDGLARSLAHHRRKTMGRPWAPLSVSEPKERIERKSPSSALPRLLSAADSLELMKGCGVPVADYALVRDGAEGVSAAARIGYPVVLKAVEPLILHKTEAGAVRLGISSDAELREAMARMTADLYLVQKQARDGIEVIVGGKRDAEFGPVVVFGLGGIFVEVLKDVTMRVAPIDEACAREMVKEIKGCALLEGTRGRPPADIDTLTAAIAAVSRILADHPEIETLDINPIRVFPKGQGCEALDVKVGVKRGE